MSARNLVLCFDGTNNQFGPENTNVVRLIQMLERDSTKQRLYYDPGVGTLPEPGVKGKVRSAWSKIKGLGFGAGLLTNVQEAYSYLMEYWEPGDRVYVFGFSRGAYTARVLAGLLHALGLLPRGNHNLIPYVLRYFQQLREDNGSADNRASAEKWKIFCEQFRRTFGRQISEGDTKRRFPIHFMGLWDTVSSVGWVWNPKHFPYPAYNPSIEHIRHAISIDERRAFFRQNRFRSKQGQDVIQLWFAGVHSDVGGGYPGNCGRLWWHPFVWMIDEAQKAKLFIDSARRSEVLSDPPAQPWAEPINQSLTWKWYLAEIWPKLHYRNTLPRVNLGRPRQIQPGDRLHHSALERIRSAQPAYAPPGLPKDFIVAIKGLETIPSDLPVP